MESNESNKSRIFGDFHIHSRFSRATSKDITLENLERYARLKGLNILGTGDFTHPKWIKEIKEKLTENGYGVLVSKSGFKFILQTEISLMYSKNDRARKIHLVVLAPSLDIVEQITDELKKYGRVDYDGRPIFGMTAPHFVEIMSEISDRIEVIPAHAWTPWFGVFGSKSGFDSLEECFEDETKKIHAIETGLSSDPPMNWRLSQLDKVNLVSNSDAHSFWPWRIGREATIFEVDEGKEIRYDDILRAVREGDGLYGTVEVNPAYGKYHYDGLRDYKYSVKPKVAMQNNNMCKECNKKLTLGVLHRVEQLADRPKGFVPKNAKKFYELLPLMEVIANSFKSGLSSKIVFNEYYKLIKEFGNEFNVLLKVPLEELERVTYKEIAENIIDNREGRIKVIPGYDGVYGKPLLRYYLKKSKDTKTNNKERKSNEFNKSKEKYKSSKSDKANKSSKVSKSNSGDLSKWIK